MTGSSSSAAGLLYAPIVNVGDACIARVLSRIGADPRDFDWEPLHLARCEARVLAAAGDGLPRRSIATRDIDEFKEWIGFRDDDVRAGLPATLQRPAANEPPRALVNAKFLDAEQQREVRYARAAYVFGDSGQWQAWRPVIEKHQRIFTVDVVTATTITLPAGARLVLMGRPVVFAARQLELAGGHFVSTVDGTIAIGELVRRPS
jgi:hypothetical protein